MSQIHVCILYVCLETIFLANREQWILWLLILEVIINIYLYNKYNKNIINIYNLINIRINLQCISTTKTQSLEYLIEILLRTYIYGEK